jgi:hypothetical protein
MKTMALTGFWWLTPIIPVVRRQPGQIVHETLSKKNPLEKRAGGVAQSVGPEFKPQYHKKKKKKERERETMALSVLFICSMLYPQYLDQCLALGN